MIDKLIVIALMISECYSVCPPSNITNPCECEEFYGYHLYCGGHQYYNVTEVSERISQWFSTDYEKQFDSLWFNNTNITSLEENSFYDISFKKIFIMNAPCKIERIHENAFNSSSLDLRTLRINNVYMLENNDSPYSVYNLVNAMTNLEIFDLWNTKIDDLPEKFLYGQNLKYISTDPLKTINNYAYYGLKNIEYIRISGSFDFMPSNAFVVKDHDYNKDLTISISSDKLKGSSFELNIFTNSNRTLHLEFWLNPLLTYLNETVFGQLFDNYPRSSIDLWGNKLNCSDCNLKWIIVRRDELMPKILNIECSDGQLLYDLTIDDFNDCTPNNVTTPIESTTTSTTLTTQTSSTITPTTTTVKNILIILMSPIYVIIFSHKNKL